MYLFTSMMHRIKSARSNTNKQHQTDLKPQTGQIFSYILQIVLPNNNLLRLLQHQ